MEEKRQNKTLSLQELLYPLANELTGRCELTEEEKAEAIRVAQERKQAVKEHEEKLERRRQWEQVLKTPFTPKEMAMYVEWQAKQRGIPFVVDDSNRKVFIKLCKYFTSDPDFEKEDFSLQKGIMLCGPVGTGKTTMMRLFEGNQRQSYALTSCRKIADQYSSDGAEILHVWSHLLNVPSSYENFFQNKAGACFDDLGTEGIKRHFGDQANVMADVILNRYDSGLPAWKTHVTTNLTADEIGQYYGERVRSRMRGMFNMLTLGGEDRRK